ncbi:MAG: hypothetical protein V4724_38095 [Pseudomonadota bacterium]
MKTNLLYIFDKITAAQAAAPSQWQDMRRAQLIELITTIGLSDRGIRIGIRPAARIAEAILAARQADRALLLRIRQSLVITQAP